MIYVTCILSQEQGYDGFGEWINLRGVTLSQVKAAITKLMAYSPMGGVDYEILEVQGIDGGNTTDSLNKLYRLANN